MTCQLPRHRSMIKGIADSFHMGDEHLNTTEPKKPIHSEGMRLKKQARLVLFFIFLSIVPLAYQNCDDHKKSDFSSNIIQVTATEGTSTSSLHQIQNQLTSGYSSFENGKYIPVLTYHSWLTGQCGYSGNTLIALEKDLEMIYQNGFTVIPAQWAVDWKLGRRSGTTLPAKPVVITVDDGWDFDYIDPVDSPKTCPKMKSVFHILEDFKARHPDLPDYSPHITSFVIASPEARLQIGTLFSDNWWKAAQDSKLISIQNHGSDHDHPMIQSKISNSSLDGVDLPASGYADGKFVGKGDFNRITNFASAHIEIYKAAQYIERKTGLWPTLFAYPFGHHPTYLENNYLPNYQAVHRTDAAFCIDGGHVTKDSPIYCLPRWAFESEWSSEAELLEILNNDKLVKIFANGKSVPSFDLKAGTPFNLHYHAWGYSICDVHGTVNDKPWYDALNVGTFFSWGAVTLGDPAIYKWTITCRNESGETASASTELNLK